MQGEPTFRRGLSSLIPCKSTQNIPKNVQNDRKNILFSPFFERLEYLRSIQPMRGIVPESPVQPSVHDTVGRSVAIFLRAPVVKSRHGQRAERGGQVLQVHGLSRLGVRPVLADRLLRAVLVVPCRLHDLYLLVRVGGVQEVHGAFLCLQVAVPERFLSSYVWVSPTSMT